MNIYIENLNYGNIINPKFEELVCEKEKFLSKENNIVYLNNNDFLIDTINETENEYKLDYLNNSEMLEIALRKEIENELGYSLLNRIYELLNKIINDDLYNYDFNEISNKIKSSCKRISEEDALIELSVNRIPDIYCLILRDRQKIKNID